TVEFFRREGRLQPTDVTMRVTAPDFEPPQIQKTVRVRPDRDCERQCFLLTPKQTGTLRIQFDVLAGDLTLASRSLKTEAEPSDRLSHAAPPVLVTEELLIQVRRGKRWLWVAAAASLILLMALCLVYFF